MIKCANCPAQAVYTYAITATRGINYCHRHVPKFLNSQKRSGMLALRTAAPIIESSEPIAKPVPPKTTKKKPKVVVEEPVIDAIVEEEPVVADIETTESADADNS